MDDADMGAFGRVPWQLQHRSRRCYPSLGPATIVCVYRVYLPSPRTPLPQGMVISQHMDRANPAVGLHRWF